MPITLTQLGTTLAQTLVDSLGSGSAKVKALALAEGRKLAIALSEIAALRARGEIDTEEARMLVNVQRGASEAVLAALADSARQDVVDAVKLALAQGLGMIGQSAGALLGASPAR